MPPSAHAGPPDLIDAEKAALRAALAERRAVAAAADPDAGGRLAAMFPDALLPRTGAVVAGYVRFRSEIDPLPLMLRLRGQGCRLALPRTPPLASVAGLAFHLWTPGDLLVRSPFGVMEPPAGGPAVQPHLILVPLLGFDRRRQRLGYGAGHYDRTLAALPGVRAVGLAYAGQEVDALPAGPHDIALDAIVTPDFVIGA